MTYHKSHAACQLYGHNGYFNGSEVVPARNHDFYERTSYIGVCQDKVVPKRGYKQRPRQYAVHIEPVLNNAELTNYENMASFLSFQSTTELPSSSTPEGTTTFTYPDEVAEEIFEERTETIGFSNPTHNSVCEKKETVSYFVFFGYRLASKAVEAQLKGVDQSSCVMYCTQNINATGVPIPCYSANYEPVEEKCYLYGKRSKSNRNIARLATDSKYIFADKFCVESKKDCSAETPYIVYPAKQMHKKILTSYPGLNSVVACVAACIDNKKCKAVTYKVGLCILHGKSPASDSSLLVDGNEHTMVIENGCQLTTETVPSLLSNNLASNSAESSWEEWGLCQFTANGRRVRIRQRECSSCEDLQMEAC